MKNPLPAIAGACLLVLVGVDPSDTGYAEFLSVLRENISAPSLAPVMRPLLPQNAHMAATAGNSLIVTDRNCGASRDWCGLWTAPRPAGHARGGDGPAQSNPDARP
jgi:hypothetical protein